MVLKNGATKLQPDHVIKSKLDQEAYFKAALSRYCMLTKVKIIKMQYFNSILKHYKSQ